MAEKSAKNEKDAAPEAAAPPPKKKRSKLLFIFLGLFLISAGAGGGWWYFASADNPESEAKVPEAKPPVFVALESFTVNLLPEDGIQHFAQIGLNLKVADQEVANSIKQRLPEVRNRILLLLSSKRASELIVPAGKERLAEDILKAVMAIVAPAQKPAAKPPVTVAEAPQATQTDAEPADAADPAEPPPAAAPAAAKVATAPVAGVQEVLFTAFIIQ